MSSCSTQAYASFKLADPSVTQEQILAHLQETIKAEARSESFDAETLYGPLADAFDYDEAFDALQDDNFVLSEYTRLNLNEGVLDLVGVPLLNEDDHVTRWIAWVLFHQFGAGDVLTFSNKTIWNDGVSGYVYDVSRDRPVKAKTSFVKTEED
jgi:hypothetical protein